MAKKINEVWNPYNAKGQKIQPYKSNYNNDGSPKTLIGRIWHTFKENWIELTITIIMAMVLIFALMYAMFRFIS